MLVALLNSSIPVLTSGTPTNLQEFRVGATAGFIPDEGGSNPIPSTVYTSNTNNIFKTIVNQDEVIISLKIPHNVEISVGNIVLYLEGSTPFVWFVLPAQHKKASTHNTTGSAGDIYFFHFLLNLPDITTRIDFSDISDYYADAPTVADLASLYSAVSQESDQIRIDDLNGRVVLATRFDGNWYGAIAGQDISQPELWKMDGGVAGDSTYEVT